MVERSENLDIVEEENIDHIEGWVVAENPDTGEAYYLNIYTNEQQADKPEPVVRYEEEQKAKRGDQGVITSGKGGGKDLIKQKSVLEDMKAISAIDKYASVGRQATEYTIENAPYSADSDLNFKTLDTEFIQKVSENDFWEYANSYVVPKSSLFKKFTIDQTLSYQTNNIDKPLTQVSASFRDITSQTFKNILSYCGDRSSSKDLLGHAKKLMKYGMEQSSEIRDEIYIQLIKQYRNNPNPDKVVRVWRLFGLISSAIAPSESLYYPLLNYLMSIAVNEEIDEEIRRFARFTFKRVHRAFEDEARKREPSADEVNYVEARKQIMIPVYFLTGNHTFVAIESYSNAQEVKELLLKKLQIEKTKWPYLGLYEIVDRKDHLEERFVENHERICDVLAIWDIDKAQNKQDKNDYKLYLKVRVFFRLYDHDIDAVVMYYTQCVYDIIHSRIPLTEEEGYHMCALQLQIDWGDFSERNKVHFMEKFAEYVPVRQINNHTAEEWWAKIQPFWTNLKGLDRSDARWQYLEWCRQQPLYLAHQFYAAFTKRGEEHSGTEFPEFVILGVTPEALVICDNKTREVIQTYKMHQILTWGISTEYFVPVTGDKNAYEKVYFETPHARQIDFLLQSYTKLKLKQPIPTTLTKVTHSTKQQFGEKPHVSKIKMAPRNAVIFPKK